MIRIGTYVRLARSVTNNKKERRKVARVEGRYPDIKGGVILDRMLFGFYSWNTENLVRVKARRKHGKKRAAAVRPARGR